MVDETEKIEALEEAVRLLESVKTKPGRSGELDFDEARMDSHLTTALSAAHAAFSMKEREDSETPGNSLSR